MSTTDPTPNPASAPSLLRGCRFPIGVLIVAGVIFGAPWIWMALEEYYPQLGVPAMETTLGEGAIPFLMFTQWLTPLLLVGLLAFWWLFFSGVAWSVRIAVVLLAVGLFVGFMLSVRKFELTMGRIGLVPRVEFVWDTSAETQFEKRSADDAGAKDGLPPIDAKPGADDFPNYRGLKSDGVVSFLNLQSDWAKSPPDRLWSRPSPGGYSGVAVAGNIVVTILQRPDKDKNEQEVIVCLDRATGRQRWAFAYDAYHKDVMGDGPRATPTIRDNRIYSLGGMGDLVCLSIAGKKQWATNILSDSKAKKIQWGMTASPLLVDDIVIVNSGIDPENPVGPSLLAYDAVTGKPRWQVGKRKAGYSSPQLATLAGVTQVLLFDGEGLVSYDPKTGAELWQHSWVTVYEMNSIQPVVLGDDRVFISSELAIGCAMLKVKPAENDKVKWNVDVVWKNKSLAARFANPVTDGKRIFGLHNTNGILTCLDANDGSVLWKGSRQGPGQMLLVNNERLLVVNGESGEVSLFNADGTELGQFRALSKADKTWNTPAIAGDQLFIRNQAELVAVRLPKR